MYEIVALFLFVIAIVLVAYVWILRRERGVLLREIEVRTEKRLHACMRRQYSFINRPSKSQMMKVILQPEGLFEEILNHEEEHHDTFSKLLVGMFGLAQPEL